MAFDITTAKPEKKSGFDIRTARPVAPQANAETAAQPEITQAPMSGPRDIKPYGSMSEFVSAQRNAPVDTRIPQAGNLANEAAAGASRPIAAMVDFFGIDRVNDVLRGLGVESQIPTASAQIPAQGTFDPSGLGKAASAIGSGVTTGGIAGAGLRGAAGMLNPKNLSTGAQVLRNVAAATPAADVITGGMSGAGTVPGGAIGEAVGGETGRQIGELVGGVAGALPYAATRLTAVREQFDPKGLLTDADGLPKPEFAKALKAKGIDYGALIDDAWNLPVVKSWKTPADTVDDIIKSQLKEGKRSDALYKFKLIGDRVVDDATGEEAVRQGFEKGAVVQAKQANQATRAEMLKQLNIQRKLQANYSDRTDIRPGDVAGKHVMNGFRFLRDQTKKYAAELDSIVSREGDGALYANRIGNVPESIKGKAVDTSAVSSRFFSDLDSLGVKVPQGADPAKYLADKKANPFVGSEIQEDPSAQRLIRRVANLLATPGDNDALRAHHIKKQIDRMVDYLDQPSKGLTPIGENFAKSIRRELNQVVRQISPKYAEINDKLSASIESINSLRDAVGPTIRLFDEGADSAVGTRMRGLLGNIQSRANLRNAVDSIESTAKSLGYKNDVNIRDLVIFADTLETRFKPVATSSFLGDITKTQMQNALRPSEMIKDKLAEGAMNKVQEFRNINDTEAFNTMHKLLRGK